MFAGSTPRDPARLVPARAEPWQRGAPSAHKRTRVRVSVSKLESVLDRIAISKLQSSLSEAHYSKAGVNSVENVYVREMLARYRFEENLREAEQNRLIREAEATSSPAASDVGASPSRSRGRIAGNATSAGKVSGL